MNSKWTDYNVLKCCLVHLLAQAAESGSEARSRREFASDETNGGRRPEAGQSQSEAWLRGEDMVSDTMCSADMWGEQGRGVLTIL